MNFASVSMSKSLGIYRILFAYSSVNWLKPLFFICRLLHIDCLSGFFYLSLMVPQTLLVWGGLLGVLQSSVNDGENERLNVACDESPCWLSVYCSIKIISLFTSIEILGLCFGLCFGLSWWWLVVLLFLSTRYEWQWLMTGIHDFRGALSLLWLNRLS